jgi:hypothetical protein
LGNQRSNLRCGCADGSGRWTVRCNRIRCRG